VTAVLIVEDHRAVATGLQLGLAAAGYEVTVTDGDPATLGGMLEQLDGGIVLLDLYLGPHGSGLGLIPTCIDTGATVVVLTSETDPLILAQGYEAGAVAVINKSIPFDDLIAELAAIAAGRSAAAEQQRHEILRAARYARRSRETRLAPFAGLTRREEEVLAMLVDGLQAAAIAEASYVSLSTVRTQIRSILTKLGVGSQLKAVTMAVQAGWAPRRSDAYDG
jgi:DNA-binding NarL/FixJ family response regulator